jgi:hypothetical protein
MTSSDIKALFQRLGRLVQASHKKEGDGMVWDFCFPDGETHHYVIRNIQSHLDVEDSVSNLLIWIWNSKDYLQHRLQARGFDPKYVKEYAEQFIDDNHQLAVCGDLAIRLKHGTPYRSRTKMFPRLGTVGYTIPQTAIRTLSFKAFEVDIDVGYPNEVEYRLPILDKDGLEMGDSLEFATAATSSLETLWKAIEDM